MRVMGHATFFPNPVNIGTPEDITVWQLAQTIIGLTESKSKIKYVKLPEDDPKQRQPDITKAQTHFGWNPTTSLEVGLLKTIEYFKKELKL